ncbi:hypothetical protein GALMADRAFT_235241 [Galerina marginata CBS 339.88]|uniref:Uncharacterized protein n=1 Tax=Galerina marginata (strain CBS 339.88) TaxID=685588 RepID=A0A067TS95_GALM3|nr:hypothetical protein GALMADRAFT_235241 [Galerina marginata CBS 339.88]
MDQGGPARLNKSHGYGPWKTGGSPSDEGSWFVVRGSRSRFGELFSHRMRLSGVYSFVMFMEV